jgi:hypothetical protein
MWSAGRPSRRLWRDAQTGRKLPRHRPTPRALLVTHEEREKEIKRLQHVAAQGERAIEEAQKLRSKLASAESALNAASRVADKERHGREIAEEQLNSLLDAVRAASEGESRLERLVRELDEEGGR